MSPLRDAAEILEDVLEAAHHDAGDNGAGNGTEAADHGDY